MMAMLVLAAESPGIHFDITQLVQYGVLGVFAILLLLARIVPWSIYEEKKKEVERLNGVVAEKDKQIIDANERHETAMATLRDAKDAEIKSLQSGYQDKVFPLLIRVTDVLDRRPRAR